jgi:Trk K+ transport system NAD-binding subunit
MRQLRIRILLFLLGLLVLLLGSAQLYEVGMETLEGKKRTYMESLGWAAETISTTGYGKYTDWDSPWMVLFVIALQFIGVFLIFLIFPIFLIPFLEERFEAKVPKVARRLTGHVVIFHYGPSVESLLAELRASRIPTLVVEQDETIARGLMQRGVDVILAGPDARLAERARLLDARALVVNGPDDQNAAVTLGARQAGFEGDILALVEHPFHRRAMMLAGSTMAYTPRHILAAALVARASERVSPRVAGVQQLGRSLLVREIRVADESELAGRTLAEADLGALTLATVIGQWVGGRLVTPAGPEMVVEPGGILVAVGSAQSLDLLEASCGHESIAARTGPIVVAGYGEVGGKAVELLREVGENVLVVDRVAGDGVDVVGDMLDPQVIGQLPLADCRSVILALDSDSANLFAAVILKDLDAGVPVIARVNQAQNVERIHAAGADFALSISRVSGQMLAHRLIGEEAISIDPQLKLLKVEGSPFAGRHPAELDVRQRTGCSVVAVERDDQVVVEFAPEFRVEETDSVYICGSAAAARRYAEIFPG